MKFVKPLPKPIEQSRKKRGGKRVRKMKERYAMTEFRKNANRLNFGDVSDLFLSIFIHNTVSGVLFDKTLIEI